MHLYGLTSYFDLITKSQVIKSFQDSCSFADVGGHAGAGAGGPLSLSLVDTLPLELSVRQSWWFPFSYWSTWFPLSEVTLFSFCQTRDMHRKSLLTLQYVTIHFLQGQSLQCWSPLLQLSQVSSNRQQYMFVFLHVIKYSFPQISQIKLCTYISRHFSKFAVFFWEIEARIWSCHTSN